MGYHYTNYKAIGVMFLLSCISHIVVLPFDLNKILTHMLFFALGSYLWEKEKPNLRYIVIAVLFSLVLHNFFRENIVINTTVSVSWALFFYALFIFKEEIISNKVLVLLGQECLAIYLLHPFLVAVFKFVMLDKIGSAIVYGLFSTLLCIGVIIISVYVLRKIDWYDYVFNLPAKFTIK